jgi:hypothetical protein
MTSTIRDYNEFWPAYLNAHRKKSTRALHYIGTLSGMGCLVLAIVYLDWRFLVAAPVIGYACAWIGHFAFEGNKPATFGHPLWSFYSDYRMLFLWATGRLDGEMKRVTA